MPESSVLFVDRKVERVISLYDKGVPFENFPEDLKELFQRWTTAHSIKLKYHYKGDDFVRELYKMRFNLNDTTARQDLRCCEIFFGKTKQTNRNYERILRIEFLKKASYKTFAEGKYKESAMYERVLQAYLDQKHDPIDVPDWNELRSSVRVTIEFNPKLVGVEPMSDEKIKELWTKVQQRKGMDIEDAVIIEDPLKVIAKIEEQNG